MAMERFAAGIDPKEAVNGTASSGFIFGFRLSGL
jgi:hypothetical protein